MSLSSSSQRALAALWRLADGSGRVAVARRSELLKASRVARGSWDRAIKGLVESGLVRVDVPASRRDPCVYMLTTQRDRATTSHKPSHNEPPLDLLLSSSKQGTKEESLEEEPREDRATTSHETEPRNPGLALAVMALAASMDRLAVALESQAEKAETRRDEKPEATEPETETETGHTEPRCACGPMIVWPNKATGEQFWGCMNGPKDRGGCGAPTILLLESASTAKRPRCPKCTGPTHLNRGAKGNFWGCDRFPSCAGKVSLEAATEPLECERRDRDSAARPALLASHGSRASRPALAPGLVLVGASGGARHVVRLEGASVVWKAEGQGPERTSQRAAWNAWAQTAKPERTAGVGSAVVSLLASMRA